MFPVCPHYGVCGGCALAHLPYEEQLSYKAHKVASALKSFEANILPVIPAPSLYHYRNKVEFTFFPLAQDKVGLGFHQKGQFNKFVNVKRCLISSENNGLLLDFVRQWADSVHFSAYDKRKRSGLLKYLIVRDSAYTHEKMVILVTNGGSAEQFNGLSHILNQNFSLAGFIWSNQPEQADTVLLHHSEVLSGKSSLMDRIGSKQFMIPLNSFFQVNTDAATILYDLIRSHVQPNDFVLDLYCGAGTISCYIADKTHSVFGIEVVPSAIDSAHINAKLNGLTSLDFKAGRVREILATYPFTEHFDTIILDPPRSGTDKKTMLRIAALSPRKVVYVACGFENLAFNIRTLLEQGYSLRSIQPLDMFPHTPHVEVVIICSKDSV